LAHEVCLVTDRRRLGKALRASPERWTDVLLTQVAAAVEAGVDLVQLREPDLEAGDLFALAASILNHVPASRERLIINERLDVALSSAAAGVHLRERSIGVDAARRLAPQGFRIGRSVHDVAGAVAALSADYLIAGTVLSTTAKPGLPLLGWGGLASIVRAAEGRPVLGIGGLTAASMRELVAAGASGLAAVGAFIPDPDQDLATFVKETVRNVRLAFDSPPRVS
jgi:thiamine-phosphate pyrophosphorylase